MVSVRGLFVTARPFSYTIRPLLLFVARLSLLSGMLLTSRFRLLPILVVQSLATFWLSWAFRHPLHFLLSMVFLITTQMLPLVLGLDYSGPRLLKFVPMV